jgi:hypothetical protein
MATASGAPPSAPPANTAWLRVVRITAWISILVIVLLYGVVALPLWREGAGARVAELAVFLLAPTLVLYLGILYWLRGGAQRKGLALAAMTGWGGLIGAVLGAVCPSADQRFAGILFVPQLLLLVATYQAHADLRRQAGERQKLMEGARRLLYLAVPLASLVFFGLTLLPEARLTRVRLNQASAVGALRVIATAEIEYARTYRAGFSRSLATLAPPTAGAQPSASAAGFIDGVLASGVKSGYRFTYTPGAPDQAGHIQTYTLTARPLEYGKTGRASFFTVQSGVIRYTTEDRPATVKDPPTGGREP